MASPNLPPALWVLPASLLAAAIAGACLGGHDDKPAHSPHVAQQQPAAAPSGAQR
jgi:hypothetical protein